MCEREPVRRGTLGGEPFVSDEGPSSWPNDVECCVRRGQRQWVLCPADCFGSAVDAPLWRQSGQVLAEALGCGGTAGAVVQRVVLGAERAALT